MEVSDIEEEEEEKKPARGKGKGECTNCMKHLACSIWISVPIRGLLMCLPLLRCVLLLTCSQVVLVRIVWSMAACMTRRC